MSEQQEARSVSNRDTQFAGFASLVLAEMLQASKKYSGLIDSESGAWQETMQNILARRAYDLVEHATWHIPYARELDDVVSYVGDLTELPKEQKE